MPGLRLRCAAEDRTDWYSAGFLKKWSAIFRGPIRRRNAVPGFARIYSHPPKVSDKARRRRQYAAVRRSDATQYEAFGGWLYIQGSGSCVCKKPRQAGLHNQGKPCLPRFGNGFLPVGTEAVWFCLVTNTARLCAMVPTASEPV